MAHDIIAKKQFEQKKRELARKTSNPPSEVNISEVPTRSWMIFEHKVSGEELNKHTEEVQNAFTKVNKY